MKRFERYIVKKRRRQRIAVMASILLAVTAGITILAFQANAEETEERVMASMELVPAEKSIATPIVLATSTPTPTATITAELTATPTQEPTPGEPEVIGEPDPAYSLSGAEREMLLKIAMAEAEGEPTDGKALVMLVVLNRVDSPSFPNTVEKVLYEENQFTPVKNGRYDKAEPDDDCYEALRWVLDGWNESEGATYFRTTVDYETWHSKNLEYLFSIGHHSFYKEKD